MKLNCPICNSRTETDLIGEYKGKSRLFKDKKLYQCSICQLIFIDPLPSADDLNDYYTNNWLKDSPQKSRERDLVYQIQAQERMKYLLRYLRPGRSFKILDIGTGFGFIFEAFKEKMAEGFEFYATDPSPDNLQRLRSRKIRAYPDLKEIGESGFDLITLFSVLEHVADPLDYLTEILKKLRPGGHLMLELPERDDTFKDILEPHVTVYTEASLTYLLNKLGLEIVHLTGYGVERAKLAQVPKRSLFRKILDKISERALRASLYEQFKFDQEGKGRWWLRVLARKK